MKYPLIDFKLTTRIFSNWLEIVIRSSPANGFRIYSKLNEKFLFELISDYFAKYSSIVEYPHEWKIIRWGIRGETWSS